VINEKHTTILFKTTFDGAIYFRPSGMTVWIWNLEMISIASERWLCLSVYNEFDSALLFLFAVCLSPAGMNESRVLGSGCVAEFVKQSFNLL
jgi:hypothetical protein